MERDKTVFDIIKKEQDRQRFGIELIASENFVSDQVLESMGSCMTNKYAEGYPGKSITVAVSLLMRPNNWPSTGPRSFSVLNMPMCNHTQGHRQIWLYFLPV